MTDEAEDDKTEDPVPAPGAAKIESAPGSAPAAVEEVGARKRIRSSGPTDVAALAGGAVAASVALAATEGPYSGLSLIMSLSLLLIIRGYVWGHIRDEAESVAMAAAIAIAAVPGAGFVLEALLRAADREPGCDGSRVDDWMIACAWMAGTLAIAIWDRRRQERWAKSDSMQPGDPPDGLGTVTRDGHR